MEKHLKDYIKILRGELDRAWKEETIKDTKIERVRNLISNYDEDDPESDALIFLIRIKDILNSSPLVETLPIGTALDLVFSEHEKQDHMFGEQKHSPEKWSVILQKEIGDFTAAVLGGDKKDQLKQAVQICAVSLQIIQTILRNKLNEHEHK